MYSNNIVNFQESTTILNAHTKYLETDRSHLVYIEYYDLVWLGFMPYQLLLVI